MHLDALWGTLMCCQKEKNKFTTYKIKNRWRVLMRSYAFWRILTRSDASRRVLMHCEELKRVAKKVKVSSQHTKSTVLWLRKRKSIWNQVFCGRHEFRDVGTGVAGGQSFSSSHILADQLNPIWGRAYYSCNKIPATELQISRQNWNGFFSNASHKIMILWTPIDSRYKTKAYKL